MKDQDKEDITLFFISIMFFWEGLKNAYFSPKKGSKKCLADAYFYRVILIPKTAKFTGYYRNKGKFFAQHNPRAKISRIFEIFGQKQQFL